MSDAGDAVYSYAGYRAETDESGWLEARDYMYLSFPRRRESL